jgi:hypothetical protein
MGVVSETVVDSSQVEPKAAARAAALMRRMHGGMVLLLLTLFISASCGAPPVQQVRFAHRGLPYAATWCRESEIPDSPPLSPEMTIWEVSDYTPVTLPTAEQRAAADDLVARTFESAARHGWFDYDKGVADGFIQTDSTHYRNEGNMLDDAVLDPERPEMLMYMPRADGKPRLAGVMYYARTRTAPGPQIGGPLTTWHYHRWKHASCIVEDMIHVRWLKNGEGECEQGEKTHRSGEMMHVWLIDHPRGPFATSMVLPPDIEAQLFAKRRVKHGI